MRIRFCFELTLSVVAEPLRRPPANFRNPWHRHVVPDHRQPWGTPPVHFDLHETIPVVGYDRLRFSREQFVPAQIKLVLLKGNIRFIWNFVFILHLICTSLRGLCACVLLRVRVCKWVCVWFCFIYYVCVLHYIQAVRIIIL